MARSAGTDGVESEGIGREAEGSGDAVSGNRREEGETEGGCEGMNIYLAGRCNTGKWNLVPSGPQSKWFASDGKSYDREHGWHFNIKGHDEPSEEDRREMVNQVVIPLLNKCDLVVAYVNDTHAYGTIAEVAYASAIGKPIIFIIDKRGLGRVITDEDGCITEELPEPWYYDDIDDAYWFVSSLPGVIPIAGTKQIGLLSIHICQQLDLIESPIEAALYVSLLRLVSDYPFILDLVSQHPIGRFRADFAFINRKVLVECDGHDYHKTKEQRNYDTEREREFMKQGWAVVRFTGTQIHKNPALCVYELMDILRAKRAA